MVSSETRTIRVNHDWKIPHTWPTADCYDDSSDYWRAYMPRSQMRRAAQDCVLHWPSGVQVQLCDHSPLWISASPPVFAGPFCQLHNI
ncbi:hypothetical protein MRX96_011064 [Rhipicephalus microplus]